MKMKRMLAVLLTVAMLAAALPTAAFAAEEGPPCPNHPTHEDCAYVAALEGQPCKHEQGQHDESCGWVESAAPPFMLFGASGNLLYKIDNEDDWNNVQAWLNDTAATNAVVRINAASTSSTLRTITIPNKNITIESTLTESAGLLQLTSTEAVVLTIKNLNMTYSSSGIDLESGSTLTIVGTNVMTPSTSAQDGSVAAIHVPQGNILTLTGAKASSLAVTATKTGAGIGGEARDNGEAAGTVNITSGKVTISAIHGAGIGGGGGLSGAGGTGGKVKISDTAEVEITMTGGGAGIGGGGNLLTKGVGGANDETTISGGKVTVYAKDGAGIGGGSGSELGGAGGTVKISGSDTLVNVTMTRGVGAGIGGGGGVNRAGGAGGNVTITGGIITVTALNNDIGGGDGFISNGDGGTLAIDSTGPSRTVLDMRGKGTNATLDHSIGVCEIKDTTGTLSGIYSKLTVTGGTASNTHAQKDYWKQNVIKEDVLVEVVANTPEQGQYFSGWTAVPALDFADTNAATTTFSMPKTAQAVTANFDAKAAPTISGPASLTLPTGYAATSSDTFDFTGSPAPTVTADNNYGGKIVWSSAEQKLVIAEGLGAGTYQVKLTASNGVSPEATHTFTLEVKDKIVDQSVITGVTAPARGAVPVTSITATGQYTGTVAWSPALAADGTFAADTAYTATITLTPKTGYTLQGVGANFFTVERATATNDADSGTIKAVFPKTSVAPTYTMSADKGSLSFGSATVGYTAPPAQTVTITNTGNQTVTLIQPAATNYTVGVLSKTELAPGETATFTVQPKAGLVKNTYQETITVSNTQGQNVSVSLSFTVTKQESSGGSDDDDTPTPTEQAVDKIQDAKPGDTVKVDLPGSGKLPNEILEAAAGKDITLEIDAGKGVTWIINGKDIPKGRLSDLDLKVNTKASTIPVTVINALTGEKKVMQLELRHNGPFGFPLTLRLEIGGENAGLWANLYYYDEVAKILDYQAAAKIDADGKADIPFSHASSYAIVIDTASHDKTNPNTGGDNPFTDVAESDWFFNAVMYVYHGGIMQGTSATTFSPNDGTTRAQLAVILWRMEGSPAPTGGNPFSDVPEGTWYSQAVAWCAGAELVGGYGGGLFGPNDPISREQLAALLYRYAQYKGWDVSVGEDTNILSYADAFDVSEWAIPAVQWACGAGIMGGTTDNRLAPQEGATRAQIAAMLMRLLEKYAPGFTLPATGGTVTPNPSTGALNIPQTGDGTGAGWLMLALPVSAAGAALCSKALRRRKKEPEPDLT